MKILIVGGTGLISTAITRLFQQQGANVVLYNRGKSTALLDRTPNAIHGDRKDFAAFEAQMAEAGHFDCVIDMICYHPDEAESAVRAFRGRTDHFIFCSTVDVYSKPALRYPVTEAAPRTPRPSFPYAYDKAKCERIFEAAQDRGDFPVTIIRPAYTYSEGYGLLHTFRMGMYYLQRIRDGRPIIVHGDGTSFWTACHRDDVARAFVVATGNAQAFGQAYHTAGEEWMTWDQYHQRVAAAMDAPAPKLVHIPTDLLFAVEPAGAEWLKENFQYNNLFDNSAAARDLDFRYTITWEEGVRRVVDWLDAHGRIQDEDEPAFYGTLLASWQTLGKRMAETL